MGLIIVSELSIDTCAHGRNKMHAKSLNNIIGITKFSKAIASPDAQQVWLDLLYGIIL